MRFTFLAASLLALAACGGEPKKEAAPATPPPAAEKQPTPEEMGQDDPSVPFKPAPVGPARKYDAMSKTAMSITGNLLLTPTPQKSDNMASGMTFTFDKGLVYETRLEPGMATQGTPAYPHWADVFPGVDPEKIEMYVVEGETIPKGAPNGGVCATPTLGIATATKKDAITGEVLMVAAFSGMDWPPSDPDKVLCGTFNYTPAK